MCYVIGLQPHSVCLCSSAEKWTDGVERTWLKIQTTNNSARKHDYVVFSALLHLDGHRKHLKLSLLDVVFITYNLTVVISPNPIRSIINPACIWVWCNLYKHFSTKVTCAEVTGLHICSRSSCMYCQGASECLYGIMCTRARSHYTGWLLQRQVTYSPFESVKATAFDTVNGFWFWYVLKMHCRHLRRMTQWRSPQLKVMVQTLYLTSSSDSSSKLIKSPLRHLQKERRRADVLSHAETILKTELSHKETWRKRVKKKGGLRIELDRLTHKWKT